MIPEWMTEPYRKILVALRRLGVSRPATINDIRKAAYGTNRKPADHLAKRLIREGLLKRVVQDMYVLTPGGHEVANELIARGY